MMLKCASPRTLSSSKALCLCSMIGDLCQIPPAAPASMATADPGGLVSDGSCPRSLSSLQNVIPQVFNPAIMGLDSKLEFNQYLLVRASVYRHLLSLATKVFMTRQTCFHCPLSLLHRRQEAMPQTENQTILSTVYRNCIPIIPKERRF